MNKSFVKIILDVYLAFTKFTMDATSWILNVSFEKDSDTSKAPRSIATLLACLMWVALSIICAPINIILGIPYCIAYKSLSKDERDNLTIYVEQWAKDNFNF